MSTEIKEITIRFRADEETEKKLKDLARHYAPPGKRPEYSNALRALIWEGHEALSKPGRKRRA